MKIIRINRIFYQIICSFSEINVSDKMVMLEAGNIYSLSLMIKMKLQIDETSICNLIIIFI